MNLKELTEKLGLTVFTCQKGLDREFTGGYASDLLSDVMGNANEGQIWITLQTHRNIMGVASLKDIPAIILVSDNKPDEDTAELSVQENLPILGSDLPAFELCGRIHSLLNP